MSSWFGSASFVLFSALFGCLLGFGIAALIKGGKEKKAEERREKEEK